MTGTPVVPNDIPAILARVNAAKGRWGLPDFIELAAAIIRLDVPNMAAEILSLRADKTRLDWLDEKREDSTRTVPDSHGEPQQELLGHVWGVYGQHLGIRDAIDESVEIARREKENG